MGKKNPKPVFTDEYFLSKAKQMEALGADMITIKDMSGLIPPHRVSKLVKLFKQNLNVPSISTPTAPRATVWHRCWRRSSQESISSIPTAGTSAAVRERRLSS